MTTAKEGHLTKDLMKKYLALHVKHKHVYIFLAVLCKTTVWNGQTLHAENMNLNVIFFKFLFEN